MLNFTENSADRGGAVYVQDYSFVETCMKGEVDYVNHDGTYCFVQVTSNEEIQDFSEFISLVFIGNTAYESGSILFGGLLDRCTISNTVKHLNKNSIGINALGYFKNISNISNHFQADFISSDPVSLCFCNPSGKPDCDYQSPPIQAKKGETFNISLVAVDQVKNTLP